MSWERVRSRSQSCLGWSTDWKLVRYCLQMGTMAAEHCCLQEVREMLEGLEELVELEEQQQEERQWEVGRLVECLVVRQADQLEERLEELELVRALEH